MGKHLKVLDREKVENLLKEQDFCEKDRDGMRTVRIPSGCEAIADYAFFGMDNIKNVIIPDTVTAIGVSAFEECRDLRGIRIPGSVKMICTSAFFGLENFRWLELEKGVGEVSDFAFGNLPKLWSVRLPKSAHATRDAFIGSACEYSIFRKPVTKIARYVFHDKRYMFIGSHLFYRSPGAWRVTNEDGLTMCPSKHTRLSDPFF